MIRTSSSSIQHCALPFGQMRGEKTHSLIGLSHALQNGLHILVLVRQIEFFVHQWKGRVVATDALNGRLQAPKARALNRGHDFGSKATREGCLVTHHEFARLCDGSNHRGRIPRHNGLQINQFARNAVFFFRHVAGRLQHAQVTTPSHHGHVRSPLHNVGRAERNFVIARGDGFHRGPVQSLGF
jgi:hypothetical protein